MVSTWITKSNTQTLVNTNDYVAVTRFLARFPATLTLLYGLGHTKQF